MNGINSQISGFQLACIKKLNEFNDTNFQSFISIVDTQTFYFTSSKLLNDISELTHGFKIIKDIIFLNQTIA